MFWNAYVVTALNPKSIVFFVAFVPQFVNPARPAWPQFVILEATFLLLAAFAFARSSSRLQAWLHEHPKFGPLIDNWQQHGSIDRTIRTACRDDNGGRLQCSALCRELRAF